MKVEAKIDAGKLRKAAEILKCIGHPVRLQILELLDGGKRMTVSELGDVVNIEQSLLSHHLLKMKDKGILYGDREGKNIYYYLAEKNITSIFDCMEKCEFFK